MRNLKKVLVMVLALAMMLSIMVVGAGAVPEAFTDVNDIDGAHKEAVEMATQLNIIEGFPDKSFQPKGDVTRAQISKMICIAINGGEVPATAVKADPSYNDIKGHWAEGFIEYCTAKGIIAGYPDGSFKPEQPVTGAEAAKMMLVALGYNADVENYVGDDWDLYVNVQANQDGLYVDLLDVADLTTTNLTREHTAQMVWNMLQAFTVKATSTIDKADGSVKLNYAKSDVTMFTESYKAYFDTGILTGFSHSDGKWTYWIDTGANNLLKVKNANDYTDWLGQSVKVAYNNYDKNATFKSNDGTAYGIFHDEGEVLAEALFGDLGKLNITDDTVTIDGKTFRMDGGTVDKVPVYMVTNADNSKGVQDFKNAPLVKIATGTQSSDSTASTYLYDKEGNKLFVLSALNSNPTVSTTYRAASLWDIAGQYKDPDSKKTYSNYMYDHLKFKAVSDDNDGKIDYLLVVPYSVAQVTNVNGSKVSLNVYDVDGIGSVRTDKQFLEDVEAYDGIKRDDWVVLTQDVNTLNDKHSLVKAETISGEISKANDRTPYDSALCTINGTQYAFSYYFDCVTGFEYELCKVGNTLNNAVIVNNHIFSVDTVKKAAITEYALVTSMGSDKRDGDWAKMLFHNSKGASLVSTADAVSTAYVNGEEVSYIDANGNGAFDEDKDIYEGILVVYARNADNDYILTRAVAGRNDYRVDGSVTGGDVQKNGKTAVGYLYGDGYVNFESGNFKATINNDAVVFVRYQTDKDQINGTYSYKVISGAQLKLNDAEEIGNTKDINTLILGSVIRNVNYVELAYVDVIPGLEDSETLYGYVQDGNNGWEVSNNRGDSVMALDLWTTDADGKVGFKHLQFAGSIDCYDADGLNIIKDYDIPDTKYTSIEPGMLIAYKMNDAGDISQILGFYDVDSAFSTYNDKSFVVTGAISSQNPFMFTNYGYTNDNGNWVVPGYAYASDAFGKAGGRFFDFDDAVTMYVDNTAQKGSDTGSVFNANKSGEALVNNALIVYNNNNGSVALLVVDVENDINEGRPVMNTAE